MPYLSHVSFLPYPSLTFPCPPRLLFFLSHLLWASEWSLIYSSCDFCGHHGTHKRGCHTHLSMPIWFRDTHYKSWMSQDRFLLYSDDHSPSGWECVCVDIHNRNTGR